MRIIAGQFKGRKLASIKGTRMRPTSDRVREALFNILAHKPQGSTVLDLFSGSGALGLETLSRGASHAVFIDNDARSLAVLRENITRCKAAADTCVIQWDITRNLFCLGKSQQRFDLVFLDPPYGSGLIEQTLINLMQQDVMTPDALIVAEHPSISAIHPESMGLALKDRRRYGKTALSFMARCE